MSYNCTVHKAFMLLARAPLFVDTETTGLGDDDQVVEIAIVDMFGNTVLNTLVKPMKAIPEGATNVHGITDEDVDGAPRIDEIGLEEILAGRHVVMYNMAYDTRIIKQSYAALGKEAKFGAFVSCAMELYSEFAGAWDDYHHHLKWWKLEEAAAREGVVVDGTAHRALADAKMTRDLVVRMADSCPEDRCHLSAERPQGHISSSSSE